MGLRIEEVSRASAEHNTKELKKTDELIKNDSARSQYKPLANNKRYDLCDKTITKGGK